METAAPFSILRNTGLFGEGEQEGAGIWRENTPFYPQRAEYSNVYSRAPKPEEKYVYEWKTD